MGELSLNQFQGIHMNESPVVEDLPTLNFQLYVKNFVDRNIIGELASRNVQKYENAVRLLRYNDHFCYVNNFNAVFQQLRCFNSETFFNNFFNFGQHLTRCSERVKDFYPSNVSQIRETLFDERDFFGIKCLSQQKH